MKSEQQLISFSNYLKQETFWSNYRHVQNCDEYMNGKGLGEM